MNNEPVAWMRENEVWEGKYNFSKEKPTVYPNAIPLYTHPAELTDKEMKEIAIKHQGVWDEDTFLCLDYRSFAREILEKAHEK